MAIDQLPTRARGCILAGALGDAWGSSLAGTHLRQQPLFATNPRLSDDAWLALATCEAIVRDGGRPRPERIAAVFQEWFEQARFSGLGSPTLQALRDLSAGAHWTMSGARGDSAAGAGVALRAAPLAFFLDGTLEADRALVRDIIRVTHHDEEACAGALAMMIAIQRCLESDRMPPDMLATAAAGIPDTRVRDRLLEMRGFRGEAINAADTFGTAGHVTDAVPLALLIAERHPERDLEAAFDEAATGGRDADAVAAMVGQILGAAGCDVPGRLLATLPQRADVEAVLEPFAQLVTGSVV
jgi:ADP-ribosyl-[dinitrogen reductase] hydrolase